MGAFEARTRPQERRYRVDGWEVFVAAGSAVALGWFLIEDTNRGNEIVSLPLVALASICLIIRMRHPLLAIGGIILTVAGGALLDAPPIQLWVVAQLVLLSTALTAGRRRSIGYALGIGMTLFACQVLVYGEPVVGGLTLGVLSWTLGVWGLAAAISSERTEANEWEERARSLQRSRAEEIRRTIAEERLRIARDLHDELGHNIATIGINAGAAEAHLESDPARTREALRVVRASSRNVLAELQQILGILRSEDDSPSSPTTINELIEGLRSAGLSVAAPPIDTTVLAPDGAAAAYRAVQEGLTNAGKHGHGPVTLECQRRNDAWHLTISNATNSRSALGTGFGLIGMRERVEQAGGALRVAETPTTFALQITLPLKGDPS